MLSLAPLTARQFRAIALAALGEAPGPDPPALALEQGPEGQVLALRLPGITVTHRTEGHWPPAEFLLPLTALDDARTAPSASAAAAVAVAPLSPGVRPADGTGPVPDAGPLLEPPPPRCLPPAHWLVQPRASLQALGDAARIAADVPGRFDLGRVLLRGRGEVLASDGVQALRQSGLSFPWRGDLLVSARGLRATRLLPGERAVALAHAGTSLVFQTGAWEITLTARPGRFPAPDLLARPRGRPTRLALSPRDAALLAHALRPGPAPAPAPNVAQLELTQPAQIQVPGLAGALGFSGRLVLYHSRTIGPARGLLTRTCCLRQALALGFRNFCFWGPGCPARADDRSRTFAWQL